MKKVRTKLFTLILILTLVAGILPARGQSVARKVTNDTTHVCYNPLPNQVLSRYRNSTDFRYKNELPAWSGYRQQFLYRLGHILESIFRNSFSNLLLHIIFVIILVILLLSLYGTEIQSVFTGRRNIREPDINHSGINIQETNLDEIIRIELEAGNYDRAVRYLYVKLLRRLSATRHILWQRDKTNRDYQKELAGTPYVNDFMAITRAYEYIWYGKFPCTKARYDSLEEQVENLYKRLHV